MFNIKKTMNKVIEASQDLFMWFITFFVTIFPILYFIWILWLCFFFKENKENMVTEHKQNKKDPFIIVFRKTRTESLIISRIEEICKTRDIQFVISCYYYNNEKSIQGCVYVVTSKVLFKLFFIKTNLISKEVHNFKNFISSQNKSNNSYSNIIDFLDKNNNYQKQSHHNEFFTWSHYYLTDNYIVETNKVEDFLKTF